MSSTAPPISAPREERAASPAAVVAAAAAFLALFVVVAAWPLLVYTVTLSTLGLAHVAYELRYVDERFSRRLPMAWLLWTVGLLGLVMLGRTLGVLQLWDPRGTGIPVELGLVVLLTVGVLPWVAGVARGIGALAASALAAGTWAAPGHTIAVLAFTHNFTPVGFLWEVLPAERRALGLAGVALGFGVAPLLLATGVPGDWVASLLPADPALALWEVGGLKKHLGAYLHADFHARPWAVDVFSAAVFAQCMHYLATIWVLPRSLPSAQRGGGAVPWPAPALYGALVLVATALLFAGFYAKFGDARSVYGIAAAAHAWVELPLLLVALAAPGWRLDAEAAAR